MDKIQLFLLENGKKFHTADMERIREKLQTSDDTQLYRISGLEYKDPMMMLVISILIGVFGVDRFMIGQTGLGVAKLLTFGGCGIWALVDLFLIMDETKKYNMAKVTPFL